MATSEGREARALRIAQKRAFRVLRIAAVEVGRAEEGAQASLFRRKNRRESLSRAAIRYVRALVERHGITSVMSDDPKLFDPEWS